MIAPLQRAASGAFQRTEAALNRVFGAQHNPLYQLGALAFWSFWITAITGVYLYVFFDTSIGGAYASVERLTVEQWWLGGIMRSLHRYASAAMAVAVSAHLLREFALGRFTGARAFSWISGVPLLWLLFASALGGYLLVWDMLAQYLAIATAEWLDWLPVFGEPLARNFLAPGSMSDRLFSLLVFLHIALPLFLLAGMFIHVKRIKLPRTGPSRRLTWGTLLTLTAVSLARPATSMAPADLTRSPAAVNLDWFYMNVYPLLDLAGPAGLWAVLAALTALLVLLPRVVAAPMPAAAPADDREPGFRPRAATVDPDNCNGCSWCFQDCPFEAITMTAHEHKPGQRQARVDPDLCTGCGICAGACPSATPFRHVDELVSGIEIPDFPMERLRRDVVEGVDGRAPATVVFGCDHAARVTDLADGQTATFSLPCIGVLPPSFVDWLGRRADVAAIVISGCHPSDCFHRLGSELLSQRLAGERQPHMRTTAGHSKVSVFWAAPREADGLRRHVDYIRDPGPPPGTRDVRGAAEGVS